MKNGQALIVVLLLLSVLITVGLSVASRSVTEVSLTTTEEESSRALSAAEAGVEAVINKSVTSVSGPTPVGGTNQTYQVGTTSTTGAGSTVTFPDLLRSGDSVTLALQGASALENSNMMTQTIHICWGDPEITTTSSPALEAILYYQTGSTYYSARKIWDTSLVNFPDAAVPLAGNYVNNGTINCPTDRNYQKFAALIPTTTLGLQNTDIPLFLRLKLITNSGDSHYVAVGKASALSPFPAQGQSTPVTGQSGQTTRKVQVFERTPRSLSIFDFALLAGGSIQ
jgi:Tfp pilus assembly protein PilX